MNSDYLITHFSISTHFSQILHPTPQLSFSFHSSVEGEWCPEYRLQISTHFDHFEVSFTTYLRQIRTSWHFELRLYPNFQRRLLPHSSNYNSYRRTRLGSPLEGMKCHVEFMKGCAMEGETC